MSHFYSQKWSFKTTNGQGEREIGREKRRYRAHISRTRARSGSNSLDIFFFSLMSPLHSTQLLLQPYGRFSRAREGGRERDPGHETSVYEKWAKRGKESRKEKRKKERQWKSRRSLIRIILKPTWMCAGRAWILFLQAARTSCSTRSQMLPAQILHLMSLWRMWYYFLIQGCSWEPTCATQINRYCVFSREFFHIFSPILWTDGHQSPTFGGVSRVRKFYYSHFLSAEISFLSSGPPRIAKGGDNWLLLMPIQDQTDFLFFASFDQLVNTVNCYHPIQRDRTLPSLVHANDGKTGGVER